MIQKCKHCDGAVIYNPGVRKMECICCGSFFEVEELSSVNINDSQESYSQVEEKSYSDNINIKDSYSYSQDDTVMECNIYTCTTCGAQLALNGVESSTYCAYCGQPTIVFDRVSLEKKPKYIIPFQFDKEQAIGAIRERLNKGFFRVSHINILLTYLSCYIGNSSNMANEVILFVLLELVYIYSFIKNRESKLFFCVSEVKLL